MLQDIGLQLFTQIILPALATVLTALVAFSIRWVLKKTNLAENEYARGVEIRINNSVQMAVKATEQQLVQNLKQANADGKLTPNEILAAHEDAMNRAFLNLSQDGIKEAKRIMSDEQLRSMINQRIEAMVHDLRFNRATSEREVFDTSRDLPIARSQPPPSNNVSPIFQVPEKDGGL